MADGVPLMLDRVAERRRAAALARHYRDAEELSIAEIARRLGRARPRPSRPTSTTRPARRHAPSRPATRPRRGGRDRRVQRRSLVADPR
jgi:hypothetical protein